MQTLATGLAKARAISASQPAVVSADNPSLTIAAAEDQPLDIARLEHVQPDPELLASNRIVVDEASPASAAYKMLRTRVLQRMRRNGWSTVAVTSTCPGEGKSLTAINVSISLALDVGTSVVLADLDLRKPSIHRHLGICARYGVGDFLRGTVALESVAVCPGIERLAVLTNDRSFARSSEMLTSPQTANLVRRVKQGEGRIAVFDMPPLLEATTCSRSRRSLMRCYSSSRRGSRDTPTWTPPGTCCKTSISSAPSSTGRPSRSTLPLRRKRQPLTARRATSHSRETRSSVANVRSCATASTPI